MPRELKQETYEDIAAISAFIRRNAFIYGTDLADRLDAAWKRQMSQSWHHREMEELIAKHEKEVAELKKQTGNAAAMREALEMARDALKSAEKYVYGDPPNGGAIGWDDVWPSEWHHALEAVELALSAPPRQCDVGTPEEQRERFNAYCDQRVCESCDLDMNGCRFQWAQMPYAAEEGGAQ